MNIVTRKKPDDNHKFFWQDVVLTLSKEEGLRLAEYLIHRVNAHPHLSDRDEIKNITIPYSGEHAGKWDADPPALHVYMSNE